VCVLPAIFPPKATSPAPLSVQDLELTATSIAEQTLQSFPTPPQLTETSAPSITPKVTTATNAPTITIPTETQNPILLTLTATLGTGTVIPGPQTTALGESILTAINTPNPALINTFTGTAHPQHSGTMPPDVPFGQVTLINRSKAEVYISLRCVTKDGHVTIIEYPVRATVRTDAPAGKYTYVVWVGGRQILGSFALSKSQDLMIMIYKDRVLIK
jgi:hypothetical protein